jgi:hypothetical protein
MLRPVGTCTRLPATHPLGHVSEPFPSTQNGSAPALSTQATVSLTCAHIMRSNIFKIAVPSKTASFHDAIHSHQFSHFSISTSRTRPHRTTPNPLSPVVARCCGHFQERDPLVLWVSLCSGFGLCALAVSSPEFRWRLAGTSGRG